MPRTTEYGDQLEGGSEGGTDFTSNVDCGYDEDGQPTPCRADCPEGCKGGCDTTYEGRWHDPSITVQDMRERPEAVQTCVACGHKQKLEYPGWGIYGEA